MNGTTIAILVVAVGVVILAVCGCRKNSQTPTPSNEHKTGSNAEGRSDNDISARWKEFADAGPSYALPIRRYHGPSKIASCPGSLYVGLYPKSKFQNLADFVIFQFYSSSIQQDLFQTGKVDKEWFVPQSQSDGVAAVSKWLEHARPFSTGGGLGETLSKIGLPTELKWIVASDYTSWNYSTAAGELAVVAESKEGYLTIFTIED